jgi:outer membrane murein-binding lipoprotein Lpp
MKNAVAENCVAVTDVADDSLDLLNGLDADETAFVDGADADADAAELVDADQMGENAMEQAADAASVADEQAGAGELGDTSAQPGAEPTGPAVNPEVLSLRQQLDKLRSQLCQQQYSDREIVEQSAKVRSLSDEVRDLESQVKETKGELTAAKERHDSAVRELQGIAVKVVIRPELESIDEDAGDHGVAVLPCLGHQRDVAGVQVAHGRHENDATAALQRRAQVGDAGMDSHCRELARWSAGGGRRPVLVEVCAPPVALLPAH